METRGRFGSFYYMRTNVKKPNKLKRYLRVSRRRIKQLKRRSAGKWMKDNFKKHPFVLAFLVLIWLNFLVSSIISLSEHPIILSLTIIFLHVCLFISWAILAAISNALRDKKQVPWYQRRRFVAFMLLFAPPIGLVFLWSESQFKRFTKILLTSLFSLYFIIYLAYFVHESARMFHQTPGERVKEIISQPKHKIPLKKTNISFLKEFKFITGDNSVLKNKLEVQEIVKRCQDSVVYIKIIDRLGQELGSGSGFIVSSDGMIVTNFHVVEPAYKAEIKVGEKTYKDVRLVKGFSDLDLALIKIEAKGLPALFMGDSDLVVTGQPIVVLGNPAGFERSTTSGIISAVRKEGGMSLLQMTAPVSPGSSGSPVFNEYGEVVGVTTVASFFMTQNLNFAVPINYLKKALSEK